MNKRLSKRTRTQLAFGAAVILLVVSAVAAYASVARLRIAEHWVGHTRDVQRSLAELNNISARAGRARTQYVDTSENACLEDYQSAAAEIPSKMQLIERLAGDNPEQSEPLSRLKIVTSHRLGVLNQSVQLKRSGSSDVQEQSRLRQELLEVSAEADTLLRKMQNNEQRLLDKRTARSDRLFRITTYILSAAFIVALALFFVHYRMPDAALQATAHGEASLRAHSVRALQLRHQAPAQIPPRHPASPGRRRDRHRHDDRRDDRWRYEQHHRARRESRRRREDLVSGSSPGGERDGAREHDQVLGAQRFAGDDRRFFDVPDGRFDDNRRRPGRQR